MLWIEKDLRKESCLKIVVFFRFRARCVSQSGSSRKVAVYMGWLETVLLMPPKNECIPKPFAHSFAMTFLSI